MNKKNLIIIMIDGCRYNWANKSELFSKLKSESVYFSQSITYAPHTIAAMHAIYSGCYGNRTGTNSYWSTYKFKKDRFKTLTEYVKDAGYYTHADLINELVVPKQGFDKFVVHDEKKDDLTIKHTKLLDSIKMKIKNNKNFFLYLHYSKIHTGIMDEVLKVYNNFSDEYFNNKKLNEERYDRLFCNAELYLKKILEKIKELEYDKNSLILIISDHGISIGEKVGERAYGAFCYDYTLRTFAYFMSPDFQPKEIEQQVRTVDFMPTILDYLDIYKEKNFENIDGESLMPLIQGNNLKEKTAFSETGNPIKNRDPPKEPNVRSIRTSKWKLIFNQYNNTKELYNLINDPEELNNLIGKNLEIEKELWEELKQYQNI